MSIIEHPYLERNVPWLDRGTFWLSTIPQGTPLWDGQRKYRLTGSNFGYAAGHGLHFKTPTRLADEMTGIVEPDISPEAQQRMDYGTAQEKFARRWYERKHRVLVKEVGLAVWKENPALACSTDGIVLHADGSESDLLIEIKSVMKMYDPLKKHTQMMAMGWTPPQYYHDHMWTTHYDQIQGNLAIMNKKWCDYIVYCEPEKAVFTYRVEYNPDYWNNELLPKLKSFINSELEPRLDMLGITRGVIQEKAPEEKSIDDQETPKSQQ